MDVLKWIVGILIIYLSVQYVVGPVMVYINQRLPKKYKFDLLDSVTFLSERDEVFRSLHEEIINNEFRYIGSAEILQSHSSMYFSIYYSDEKKITSTLITAEVAHNSTTTQIEFTQIYDDGTLLSVNNNSVIGVYPEWKIKEAYRFSNVNDFTELLAIADKIIRIRKRHQIAVPMVEGKEFETIEQHLNKELERLVHLGWVSSKPTENGFKLTPKGAVLMTWKMCWPIKSIISAIGMYRSKKVLSGA